MEPHYGSASFQRQRPSRGIIHGGQPELWAPGAELVFQGWGLVGVGGGWLGGAPAQPALHHWGPGGGWQL